MREPVNLLLEPSRREQHYAYGLLLAEYSWHRVLLSRCSMEEE